MSKKNKENIEEVKETIVEKIEEVETPEIEETDETTEQVEEPVIVEEVKETYKLKIAIAFTDKYTGEKYKVGNVIEVNEERYLELINDKRGLVKGGE